MLPNISPIVKAKAAERKLEILIPEYARLGWPWKMFCEHYPDDIALILPDQASGLVLLHKKNYQPPDLYEIGFEDVSKNAPGVGSDGVKVLDFIKCTGEPYYHDGKFFSSMPVDSVISMAPTMKFSCSEVASCLDRLESHGYLIRIDGLSLLPTKGHKPKADPPPVREEPDEVDIPIEYDSDVEPPLQESSKEPVQDSFVANWIGLYESALPDAKRIFEERGKSYWGIREDELARLTHNTSERISEIMSLIAQNGGAIRSVQMDSEPAVEGLPIRNQTTRVYWGIPSDLCKRAKSTVHSPQAPKVPESSTRKGRRKYYFPEGKQGVIQTKIVRYICTEGIDIVLGNLPLRISLQSVITDSVKGNDYRGDKKIREEMQELWKHGVLVDIRQEDYEIYGKPTWGVVYSPELQNFLMTTNLTSDFSLEIPDNGVRRELFMSREMRDSVIKGLSKKK